MIKHIIKKNYKIIKVVDMSRYKSCPQSLIIYMILIYNQIMNEII